jgi:hypothetical protein
MTACVVARPPARSRAVATAMTRSDRSRASSRRALRRNSSATRREVPTDIVVLATVRPASRSRSVTRQLAHETLIRAVPLRETRTLRVAIRTRGATRSEAPPEARGAAPGGRSNGSPPALGCDPEAVVKDHVSPCASAFPDTSLMPVVTVAVYRLPAASAEAGVSTAARGAGA